MWNKMAAKTSSTLQIYGQIYILGSQQNLHKFLNWMSANCSAQHSLLLAACFETTIHTRALREQCAQDQLFHLILKDVSPSLDYLPLINGHSRCTFVNNQTVVRSLWEKREQGCTCLSLFNYIGSKCPIPHKLQANDECEYDMWLELYEMWAVFQWSMYKVHEQKSFSG